MLSCYICLYIFAIIYNNMCLFDLWFISSFGAGNIFYVYHPIRSIQYVVTCTGIRALASVSPATGPNVQRVLQVDACSDSVDKAGTGFRILIQFRANYTY